MIFRRALLRELTLNTVLTFCVLLAIVFTNILVRLLGAAASGALPVDGVVGMLAFTAIVQMPLLLSVTLFIAVLFTLSRAWRDSEMVVWMSAGQSLAGWLRPVMQFAVPMAVLSGVLSLALSPWAIEKRTQFQKILDSRDELAAVTPGLFQESRRDLRIHFVEKFSVVDGKLENIFLNRDLPDRTETVVAKRGFLYQDTEGDRYLILEQGRRYVGPAGSTGAYDVMDFQRYGLRIDMPGLGSLSPKENGKPTLTLMSESTPIGGGELFWRFSMPLTGLIMVLAAIPLSFVNPRMGRSYNLVLGALLFFLYFNTMKIVEGQVQLGKLPWWLGLVVLHGAAFAAVVLMFYRRYQGATFWKYVKFWQRNENTPALSR
jgi:lipopolysaccharide export system permease protein